MYAAFFRWSIKVSILWYLWTLSSMESLLEVHSLPLPESFRKPLFPPYAAMVPLRRHASEREVEAILDSILRRRNQRRRWGNRPPLLRDRPIAPRSTLSLSPLYPPSFYATAPASRTCPKVVEQVSWFYGSFDAMNTTMAPHFDVLFDRCQTAPHRLVCLKTKFWLFHPDTAQYAFTFLQWVHGLTAEQWTHVRGVVQTVQREHTPFLSARYGALLAHPHVSAKGQVSLCHLYKVLPPIASRREAQFYHDAIYFLFSPMNTASNQAVLDVLGSFRSSWRCPDTFLATVHVVAALPSPQRWADVVESVHYLQSQQHTCQEQPHVARTKHSNDTDNGGCMEPQQSKVPWWENLCELYPNLVKQLHTSLKAFNETREAQLRVVRMTTGMASDECECLPFQKRHEV